MYKIHLTEFRFVSQRGVEIDLVLHWRIGRSPWRRSMSESSMVPLQGGWSFLFSAGFEPRLLVVLRLSPDGGVLSLKLQNHPQNI